MKNLPLMVLTGALMAICPVSFAAETTIPALEALLTGDPAKNFPQGKGARDTSGFEGPFDAAYRLMRLYQGTGETAKMQSLALRIARSEPPFDRHRYGDSASRDENRAPEFANAALALAIQQVSDGPGRTALTEALVASPWLGAKAQILRRTIPEPADPRTDVPWVNLPPGVVLLASDENVLSLARDKRFVFSGHPWGVGVRDFSGRLIVRIALGDAARVLAVTAGALWAGGPMGLYRIVPPPAGKFPHTGWQIRHQRLDGDLPDALKRTDDDPYENGVSCLVPDGQSLWIGTMRNVQTLNTKTLTLRSFSLEDLKIRHRAEFERIVPDGPFVWANARGTGLRRYERTTGEWSVPPEETPDRKMRFGTLKEERLFGVVETAHEGDHLPCLIDRETLAITLLPPTKDAIGNRSRIESVAAAPQGILFQTDRGPYLWKEKEGKMESLAQSLQSEREKNIPSRPREAEDDPLNALEIALHGKEFSEHHPGTWLPQGWLQLRLPNGGYILGQRSNDTRYQYPREDRGDEDRERFDARGGLFFWDETHALRRISAPSISGGLPGDVVYEAVFSSSSDHIWFCTDGGLALWDESHGLMGTYSRASGLCANRITCGLEKDGRLYFSAAWGDSGGGLIVLDPQSPVFTAYLESDGLATDKVASLMTEGDRIKIVYATEYLRNSQAGSRNYRRHPPGSFDPVTNKIIPGGEPVLMTHTEAGISDRKENLPPLPYLGGGIRARRDDRGKIYLCGTRGVVILPNDEVPQPALSSLGAKLIPDPTESRLTDVRQRMPTISSPAQLTVALKDANPLYRAAAVAAVSEISADYLKPIATALKDPNRRVRSTALCQLRQAKAPADMVAPLVRGRLRDPEPDLRALAVLTLCELGQPPAAAYLIPILEARFGYFEFPYGAERTTNQVNVNRVKLYEAVAPHATADVFSALLQHPPRNGEITDETKVFSALGESIRSRPEIIPVVLDYPTLTHPNDRQRDFAQKVFLAAGPSVLPRVHGALQSKNWVERKNAARMCAALANPSSVGPLTEALRKEDHWPLLDIVEALGNLQAVATLPEIIDAYWRFRKISDGRLREHISQTFIPGPARWDLEGRRSEEDSSMLQACYNVIASLGTDRAQDFFRSLSGDRDVAARKQAALHLSDTEQNRVILRVLAVDPLEQVREVAVTTLAALGDEPARATLGGWLKSADFYERARGLAQLRRLKESGQLTFLLPTLEELSTNQTVSEEQREQARSLLKQEVTPQ